MHVTIWHMHHSPDQLRIEVIESLGDTLFQGVDFGFHFSTYKPIPSLCGGSIGGEPALPKGAGEVSKLLRALSVKPHLKTPGEFEIFLANGDPIDPEVARQAVEKLRACLVGELNYQNAMEDWANNFASEILKDIRANTIVSPGELNLRLANEFDILAFLIEDTRHQNAETPETRFIHVYDAQYHEAIARQRVIMVPVEEAAKEIFDIPDVEGGRAFLFPLRYKGFDQSISSEIIFAVELRKPLTPVEVLAIDICVAAFLEQRIRLGQRATLYWQNNRLRALIASNSTESYDPFEDYEAYMQELGQHVLKSTRAHSFAYLQYDHLNYALKRHVIESPDGSLSSVSSVGGEKSDPILLKDWRHYLSAYLFRKARDIPDGMIIIDSIKNRALIPKEMHAINSRWNTVYAPDPDVADTVCEVAMLVEDQHFPIGVISIECPIAGGLRPDEHFLKQLVQNAGIYWGILVRKTDQIWLRRNLEVQEMSHQIEKTILRVEDLELKAELQSQIRALSETDGLHPEQHQSAESAIEEVFSYHSGGAAYMDKGVRDTVAKFLDPDLPSTSPEVNAGLSVILRNLIENNKAHLREDAAERISIVTRRHWQGADNCLVLKTYLPFLGSPELLEAAFRRPMRMEDGRDHIGLFMIGVATRTLGGRLCFDRRPGQLRRKLEICLPLGSD